MSVYTFSLSMDNIKFEFNGLNGLLSSKNLT